MIKINTPAEACVAEQHGDAHAAQYGDAHGERCDGAHGARCDGVYASLQTKVKPRAKIRGKRKYTNCASNPVTTRCAPGTRSATWSSHATQTSWSLNVMEF